MGKKLTFADIKKGTYFKIIDEGGISYPDIIFKKCDNKDMIYSANKPDCKRVLNSKIIRSKHSIDINLKTTVFLDTLVEIVKIKTIII